MALCLKLVLYINTYIIYIKYIYKDIYIIYLIKGREQKKLCVSAIQHQLSYKEI